jgi:hypothetical protein
MVNASEILKSPDYINANAATKRAIFDKHVASDENYAKANADTQRAIRTKFGVESGEGMPQERTVMQELMQAPAGIYRGFKDVTDTLIKGGASAVDYLAGTNIRANVDEAAARSAREYEQTYGKSTIAGGGRLAGNIVATAPVGAVVAAPLKVMGAASLKSGVAADAAIANRVINPLAESIGSAGFRTGLAPTTGAARAADLAVRGAGGATTGAISAGLVNPEDTSMGAAIGAVIPTVAAPVLKQFAKGLGFTKDVITSRAAEVRAADIIRNTLGDQLEPAAAALAKARPGITAVQALQEAGINADPFMALGKLAEKMDTGTAYRLIRQSQELAQTNQLAAMAGGGTQTAAREAQGAARNALTDLTTPMRTEALNRANVGGTITKALGPEVDSFTSAGSFTGQGVPKALGQAQAQLDALAAAGLKPIDTDKIVSGITAKLADPKIGPSDVNQAVLSKVANKIQEWTAKGGGVIDADALYSIRKNAVGEEIARLYPNADAKQQARFAAKLLSEIKPAIDDAIVEAGGTGWRRYLQTYETGMKKIDQQKLAALALEKFKGSKEEFIKLVRGNNPDAVEDIFGPGSFNIFKEMGRKSGQLEDIASQLERDIKVTDRAAEGAGGLARIMGMSDAKIKRIPAFFSVTATTLNKALDVLEGKVNDQVKQILVDGMKDGKSVAELVQKLPSKDRSVVLRTLMNSKQWNPEGVTVPVQLFVDRKNNLAPEQENRNSLRP